MPTTLLPQEAPSLSRISDEEIQKRLDACPKLSSLQSVNQALISLVNAEQSLTSQIAEIIRRDPSLSARLLRMVNSVYFGLSADIMNIEEAVFFLGLRQIRELSRATPVIEDLSRLQSTRFAPQLWKSLWAHSLGTAIITREILQSAPVLVDEETSYLVGLLHNLGKIIMGHAFPEHLMKIINTQAQTPAEVFALEREIIGWDHAQIGGYFLEHHHLSDEIVTAVRYHNEPDLAPRHQALAAAVQVADYMVRHVGIAGGFEQVEPVAAGAWVKLPGWKILYGRETPESKIGRASIENTLDRLPEMLGGLL
jgi:HD-like signal output (HDOD) protein